MGARRDAGPRVGWRGRSLRPRQRVGVNAEDTQDAPLLHSARSGAGRQGAGSERGCGAELLTV